MEFLKHISNKNINFIKEKIKSLPVIYINLFEKTIVLKKKTFIILGFICRGSSKQVFLIINNNLELVYRCPLIKLNNDTLVINNFIENFIHSFLSNLNNSKILKVYYLGYNSEYNYIASFIEKMDGTLYGFLKKENIDFKTKLNILLKELYDIAYLLEELQNKYKFVHNDLKCDNIFYKDTNFYIGDFDNTSIEIEKNKINWQEFNQKKDLFILTQSLYFSFNDKNWRENLFKYFPVIENVTNQNDFHQLYNYKDIDDIYIPSNYRQILKNLA